MNGALVVVESIEGEIIPPDIWRSPSLEEKQAMLAEVRTVQDRLKTGLRTTVETAVELGNVLLRCKARYRGMFLHWVEQEAKIHRRMAATYMRLARAKGEIAAPKWKRISTLGVAGAVTELRREKRQLRERTAATPPTKPMPERNTGREMAKRMCELLKQLHALGDDANVYELAASCPPDLRDRLDDHLMPAFTVIRNLYAGWTKLRDGR